jgi:hypothetical protein
MQFTFHVFNDLAGSSEKQLYQQKNGAPLRQPGHLDDPWFSVSASSQVWLYLE